MSCQAAVFAVDTVVQLGLDGSVCFEEENVILWGNN